ncbi:hypothetical protein L3X38_023623 [Prunus dulcis]|uniref:Transposable element protein n=1 Tax=Prunus dulcis TaxID=3755 RepID=A0AAD4W062_PRUDU|nr:hypothetical protein L3X38_023623 [Prunus dulcis]
MNAYSGYNQIFMHPEDQAHTSFVTDCGLYSYKVMPFDLKNVGPTYQRMVNSLFAPLIGNTMEVYIDDMLVKSCTADHHIPNHSTMFTILKQDIMRLNPPNVYSGWLQQIPWLYDQPERPLTTAPYSSRPSRVASEALPGLPSVTRLSANSRSIWAGPFIVNPKPGDILMVYLSVSITAVSYVLIRPRDNAEYLVHYVSKALQDAEVRYPNIEKLAFALVVSARRLRPYFQAHTIHVLTNQPLRQVL